MAWLLRLLSGGLLDRVFDTIDRRIEADADRERIKADLIAEYYRTRPGFMRAGGFVLMLLFAAPLAFWFSSVCIYSVFWCAGCAFPKPWTIAALPAPLNEWAGWIIMAIFGVLGAVSSRGR